MSKRVIKTYRWSCPSPRYQPQSFLGSMLRGVHKRVMNLPRYVESSSSVSTTVIGTGFCVARPTGLPPISRRRRVVSPAELRLLRPEPRKVDPPARGWVPRSPLSVLKRGEWSVEKIGAKPTSKGHSCVKNSPFQSDSHKVISSRKTLACPRNFGDSKRRRQCHNKLQRRLKLAKESVRGGG
jgi:hypothetical protein